MKDRRLNQKPVQVDHRGARIAVPSAEQMRPAFYRTAGRVHDSRILQEKIKKALDSTILNATKLNDIFFNVLMRSSHEWRKPECRAMFDMLFFLFEDRNFNDPINAKHFTKKAKDDSFISTLEIIKGKKATQNEKLRFIGFAGLHLGLANVANHLARGAELENYLVIAKDLQFLIEELEHFKNFISSCYQVNIPIYGLVDDRSLSASYIDSMKKSQDELLGIINHIKDSILPFYKNSIDDLKISAGFSKDYKTTPKHVRNKRPRIVDYGEKSDQIDDGLIGVEKQAYIGEQLSVVPRCIFSVAPRTVFIPEDYVKQIQVLNLRGYDDILSSPLASSESHPLSTKVEEELPSPIILPRVRIRRSTPTPVAVEPIPSAYAGKIIATPVAALAGALFGFAAGIVLLPFTGGTSILLSVAMAVTVASICAGSAYVGGSLTDEGTVAIRKAAVQSDNKPCKSTDDIFRSLDVKIDKTVNKVSEQVEKLKNKVGQLKLFSNAPVSKSPSVQMKEISNRKKMPRAL